MPSFSKFYAFEHAATPRLGRDILSMIRREMRFTRDELATEGTLLAVMMHMAMVDGKSRLDEIKEKIEGKMACMQVLGVRFAAELFLFIQYEQELSDLERAYREEAARFRRNIKNLKRQARKVRAEFRAAQP